MRRVVRLISGWGLRESSRSVYDQRITLCRRHPIEGWGAVRVSRSSGARNDRLAGQIGVALHCR